MPQDEKMDASSGETEKGEKKEDQELTGEELEEERAGMANEANEELATIRETSDEIIEAVAATPAEKRQARELAKKADAAKEELQHEIDFEVFLSAVEKIIAEVKGGEKVNKDVLRRLTLLEIPSSIREALPHFDDAREITMILKEIFQDEFTEQELNEIALAGYLHDVGKTGPPDIPVEEQEAITEIFNFDGYKTRPDEITIEELLEEKDVVVKKEETGGETETESESGDFEISEQALINIKKYILEVEERRQSGATEAGALPSDENAKQARVTMRQLYDAHGFWTYDILKKAGLDPKIVKIAASHHILEGNNPAGIDLDEIDKPSAGLEMTDKYHALRQGNVLEFIDKYQSFRIRSKMSHEKSVGILKKIVETNKNLAGHEDVKSVFLYALEKIDANKEDVDKILVSEQVVSPDETE